jgi:hypothetical protein
MDAWIKLSERSKRCRTKYVSRHIGIIRDGLNGLVETKDTRSHGLGGPDAHA